MNQIKHSQCWLLCVAAIMLAMNAFAQPIADPATGQLDIRNLNQESLNANQLLQTEKIKLIIPVYNLSQANSIPAGSCLLKINIGSSLRLDPAFDLGETSLKKYFTFTTTIVSGSTLITGNLHTALPNDFAANLELLLQPFAIAQSGISVNFELVSQGPTPNLVDEDPQNNFASLQYIIVREIVPVKFTGLLLTKSNCLIDVLFKVNTEENVQQYEVEISADGIKFQKVASIPATKSQAYNASFDAQILSNTITYFVRIKSIDRDGTILYSETKSIAGTCKKANGGLIAFPNPVQNGKSFSVKKADGTFFYGTYVIALYSEGGNLVSQQKIDAFNTGLLHIDSGKHLPNGNYFLTLIHRENASVLSLPIQYL
jgi:hypothetical protein